MLINKADESTYESIGGDATIYAVFERKYQRLVENLPPPYIPKQAHLPRNFVVDLLREEWKEIKKYPRTGRFRIERMFPLDRVFSDAQELNSFISDFPQKELRQMIYLFGENASKAGERLIKYGVHDLYSAEFAYYQAPKMKREPERLLLEARLNQYLKQQWESGAGLDAWFALGADDQTPQARIAVLQAFELPAELVKERKPRPIKQSTNLVNDTFWSGSSIPSHDERIRPILVDSLPDEPDLVRGLLMGQDGCSFIFSYRSEMVTDHIGVYLRWLLTIQWADYDVMEVWYPQVDSSRFEFLHQETSAEFEGKTIQIKYVPFRTY